MLLGYKALASEEKKSSFVPLLDYISATVSSTSKV